MSTHKTTYSYDARHKRLNVFVDGKLSGGFIGNIAERQFAALLNREENGQVTLTDMSESIRKAKVKYLRGLWIKQGIDPYRDAILEAYGVKSTAELTIEQLDELIDRYKPNSHPPASELVRRLRSHCLDLMNRLGIYHNNEDWSRVNDFMMNPKIAGKLLYQLNATELETLRRKLNSILDKESKLIDATVNPLLN